MPKIYFDHSATTPVDKKVLAAMTPYFTEIFGNASSIHNFGQDALAGVDKARERLADFLNCRPGEIIFTSGATESNNLAIKGLIKKLSNNLVKPHVITTQIEHDAVLEPCAELEKEGCEVSYLPVDKSGLINLQELKDNIKENTVLVSIMYVNSEVGSILPIREAGKIVKKENDKREKEWKIKRSNEGRRDKKTYKPGKIYFHTDATQALNFLNCDVEWNNIDLLSLSGHKIYGPKGIGALYRREGVPLSALQKGGRHENGFRSGTLNVPGIVGLGAAIELLGKPGQKGEPSSEQAASSEKIGRLRDLLVMGISNNISDTVLNTDRGISGPSHAHFSFLGVEGESVLMALDLYEKIAVSTGSACASGSLKGSHVLEAMGIKKEVAHNSIRFTLGKNNTKEEVLKLVEVLPPIIEKFRKMNPIYKESKKRA
jgi:cysteine desulfurase